MKVKPHLNNSLFSIMKQSKILKRSELSGTTLMRISQRDNNEFLKLTEELSLLMQKITKPNQNIDQQISFLEFTLANGSNNKDSLIPFYHSKIPLDLISALTFSLPDYSDRILKIIDKVLQNKRLTKYISKNTHLFPKIIEYCLLSKTFDTPLRLAEILLMNYPSLYPINLNISVINKVYHLFYSEDKLGIFCRILAILIFDYKKEKKRYPFRDNQISKLNLLYKVSLQNQIICLHLNKILKNLMLKLKESIRKIKDYSQLPIMSLLFLFSQSTNNATNVFNSINSINSNQNHIYSHSCYQADISISSSLSATINTFLSINEFYSIIQLNPFTSFNPNFSSSYKNTSNIYNTYQQIAKLMKTLTNKFKIKSQNKQYISNKKIELYQIEILFVLSIFLGSKRNIAIQDKLCKLGIIESLNGYLEYIEWGNIFGENTRPIFRDPYNVNREDHEYHGDGCCCDCDSSLKLQYLRLIYTYCNRDQMNIKNKLKLFSKSDIEAFITNGYSQFLSIKINEKYNEYKNNKGVVFNRMFNDIYNKIGGRNNDKGNKDEIIERILNKMIDIDNIRDNIDKYNNDENQIGLIQKLIYKYIQECYYSSSKYWLSSCIEVILRGNNTFFQTYFACTGLLPCLLYDILYTDGDIKQIKQLSFDILGELIKFNRGNFYLLNSYLSDPKEFSEFFKIVLHPDHLVDSNVFLRSIILSNFSFNKYDMQRGIPLSQSYTKKCKIFNFIENKMYSIFISLAIVVKPDNIHQKNISCINTALIIIIIEFEKGNLKNFLMECRNVMKDEWRAGFENFKKLLIKWQNYYRFRAKDSASLEYSTTIKFNLWFKVVNILLSKNTKDEMSLNYYV